MAIHLWVLKSHKETVSEVIDSMSEDIEEKIKIVWKLMDEYKLDHKVEFADRFRNYEEIVLSEWLYNVTV